MRTKPAYLLAGAIILSALLNVEAMAQEQDYVAPKVVISKEKVRSGGKIYYAHIVQERQTLYSISKAYMVSVEEINDANPFLNLESEGLKKGQILLVPYDEVKAKEIASREQAEKDEATKNKASQEAAAKEKAELEKEKAAQEKAAKETAAKEKAEKDRLAKEEAARLKAAQDEAAREQAAKDKAAKEEAAREKAAQKKAAKDEAARVKAEQDEAARELAAQEKAAKDQAAREKAEKDRLAKEEAAKAKAARDEEAARLKAAKEEEAAKAKAEAERAKAEAEKAKAEAEKAKAQEENTSDYFIHKVKWYEDLDAIAKKYGVSKESIMNINRMTSDKLKRKQDLKIPRNPAEWEGKKVAVPEDDKPEADADNKAILYPPVDKGVTQDSEDENVLDDLFVREGNHDVNISLLLPFSAPKSGDRVSFMDFYCGALLAARTIGQSGTDLDIHTFDVGGGSIPVTRDRLASSDFTIGPVSKSDILKTNALTSSEAWIVSPLDMQVEPLTDTLGGIIQAPTPTSVQIKDMVAWIKSDLSSDDRVIIITPSTPQSDYLNMVQKEMYAAGVQHSTATLSTMRPLMTAQGTNRIVLACDYTERSTVFLIEALRNLYMSASKNTSIVLYSTSKIRTYDQIEVEQLHKVNLHTSVTYFVDYDSKDVQDFLLQYRALYNTEPSRSAYSGYDLMMYFSTLAHKYGKKWPRALHKVDYKGLQSDFNLVKTPSGSYVNNAVRRVVYNPDYSITLVR